MASNSNIGKELFSFSTVKRPAVTGSLLVAEPFLREKYFLHAVIAMLDMDPAAAPMGVVLNNGTDLKLHEVLDGVDPASNVPVYCGGPVAQDRLFFLHTLGTQLVPDATLLAPGLWVGGDFDAVVSYINDGYPVDGNLRFFLGYAGWDHTQLVGELDSDVWAVANPGTLPPQELLTLHGDRLWHRAVRAMGADYRTWAYHPSSLSAN